mgnify:CR=1 FL=1
MINKQDFSEFRTIEELDSFLTKAMARQAIQSVIKGQALSEIAERIGVLADGPGSEGQLRGLAALGRLAAVAKSREAELITFIHALLESEPGDISLLSDADQKLYVARALSYADENWKLKYCVRQALEIDTADSARRVLLNEAFLAAGDVTAWLNTIQSDFPSQSGFSNVSSFMRRIRRVLLAIHEVLKEHDELPGRDLPESLAKIAIYAFPREARDAEEEVLFSSIDLFFYSLVRILQVRLGLALESDSYRCLQSLKHRLGPGLWAKFLRESRSMGSIRTLLCEAALVLARQERTDEEVMNAMVSSFVNRPQLKSVLHKHFEKAEDVERNTRNWWESAGEERASRESREQPIGNNVDRQLGELLLIIESHVGTMQSIRDSAVPILEMQDEVAAATVNRGARAFIQLSQTVRRLARIRHLEKTELKGRIIEYSPREHDMLGGERQGVRKVRVVKDGIKKDFGGRVRFLTKPQVEPVDGARKKNDE